MEDFIGTPGTWQVYNQGDTNNPDWVILDNDGRVKIAETNWDRTEPSISPEKAEQNAALIAAAPKTHRTLLKAFDLFRGILIESAMESDYDREIYKFLKAHNELPADYVPYWESGEEWECTDPDTNQYRKTIIEDQVYLFKEDRMFPGGVIEVFEMEMDIKKYSSAEIESSCNAFGYDWKNLDTAEILECLFELET